ncbi:hypothetical protein [Vibrio sp. 779(2023)]|nr:hypothetical protein [Vibrio sp. 779(2023)]MDW3152699.1 hypothetical protein [Vibrio sp. 779(2023)]
MTKLRNTTKTSIYNRLDSTYFTANSFKIEYHESESTFVTICFLPQPEFKFQISTSKGYNAKGWVVSEAPGEHLREVERVSLSDFDQIINRIPHWAQRILEDYRQAQANPDYGFEDFSEIINKKINSSETEPDAFFDAQEAEELQSKLDAMYKKFIEISETNEELKSQLDKVQKEIECIKSDVNLFPKGTWYRVSGAKVVKMMKDFAKSSEGRAVIAETAKKYLLGL